MKKLAAVALGAALCLTGCQTVTEIPMSRTVWRLDGEGRGLIGKSGIDNEVIRRAAALAVREGYQRFAVVGSSAANSTEFGGYTPVQATSTPNYMGGFNTNITGGQPMTVDVRNTSVVVKLFNPGDPGFGDALDAQATLTRLTKK